MELFSQVSQIYLLKRRRVGLLTALALNPQFDILQAASARQTLENLSR